MPTQTDDLLTRVIERIEGRYHGKYRGEVTDNNDPDNLGRIRVKVPRLFGDEETGWALPAFPYGGAGEQGFFLIPDAGAAVWIEFEEGDLSYPIWAGTFFGSGDIPESAQPAQKVIKTKSGHKIIFDDDGDRIEITDSNGNSFAMDGSEIKISTGGAIKIVIEAPQIELVENAPHPLVFGDNLLQYLNQLVGLLQSHIHPGELAAGVLPVTPAPAMPVFPLATPALLSTKVKTG